MHDHHLSNEEIRRFSRQLLIDSFGPQAQEKLQRASALIVGAGGLGCPSALYLAASGIGCLGIIDYDLVEESNLHRQIGHSENTIGVNKALSLATSCKRINSKVQVKTHETLLSRKNALDIIKQYDVICDCSDNAPTRYLLNDACVFSRKPLVSGSALRWEGQLIVYNYANGPCYRCLFPKPPPPETIVGCSEGGVIGPVPGVIGNLQALEAIKIISEIPISTHKRLLLFDGLTCTFRHINIRSKNASCECCGSEPTITRLIDYEEFCGTNACDKARRIAILKPEERISVEILKEKLSNEKDEKFILLDCRPEVEYQICRLPRSISIPWNIAKSMTGSDILRHVNVELNELNYKQVAVICRRGNDSQEMIVDLKAKLGDTLSIFDVEDGLEAWSQRIDSTFPIY